MDYYEHYLKRLRASVERGPVAGYALPVLDLLDGVPSEPRFRMVQEFERILRDVDQAGIDWNAVHRLVGESVAEGDGPEEFGHRLRAVAGL